MPDHGNSPRKRRYPPAYERLIPIALGILLAIIIVLLVIIVLVLAGSLPFAG